MGRPFRYRLCYDAVRAVAPDLALGVADTGSDVTSASDALLPPDIRAWLRNSSTTHLFYAFHCYGCTLPGTIETAVKRAKLWGAATFLTEFGGTTQSGGATGAAAAAHGVGWTQYQYGNGYCNVPCGQGQNTCRPTHGLNHSCEAGEPCAFGACIT